MPATSIRQILAFDDAANTALGEQIAAHGVPAYIPRSREDGADAFALPLFQKGQATGHLARLPAAVGGYEYDLFSGSIIGVEVFAPRVFDETTPEGARLLAEVYDQLGDLALRVRYALRFNAGDELNARLPYHKFTNLVPLADVVGYDEERKLDRHELRWQCTLGVRPEAWPTTSAAYSLE